MAELLAPGVIIEEVPSSSQVIAPVSTSNVGVIGMSQKGPEDTATLVTSFDQFTQTFGPLIAGSAMGLSVAAFFANGGKRAYIVRVTSPDAVAADCRIQSSTYGQQIETGDGTTPTFSKTAVTTVLNVNAGASPIVAQSMTVKWRKIGTPVVGATLQTRAISGPVALVNGTAAYEARINPTALPTFDASLDSVVPGTVTVHWDPQGVAQSKLLTTGAGIVTTTNAQGSVFTFDHRTGFLSVLFAGTDVPSGAAVGNITMDFTPASATLTATDTGVRDGSHRGTWLGNVGAAGDVNYVTGEYSLNLTGFIPHNLARVLATYKINAWDVAVPSKGAYGNNVEVTVAGNPNYYDRPSDTYSKFDFKVLVLNATTNAYDTVETFEDLDFSDSSSPLYFPDVVNDLSDYVTVDEPGGNQAPGELGGISETNVLGGGDGSTAGKTFAGNLEILGVAQVSVSPGSVSISWTDAALGLPQTITDDGYGNLTGAIDTSGTNTVTYSTGAISFKLSGPAKGGTLVKVTFCQDAAELVHTEKFGDVTKQYSEPLLAGDPTIYVSGSDGLIPVTRSQISSPLLNTGSGKGLYALNQIDDIMQVIIPDFPADVDVIFDQLDYADSRKDRYIILTVPQGSSAQQAVNFFRDAYPTGMNSRYSNYAAMYWPWVTIANPLANNRSVAFPPLGHIAGIYARTDNNRNVGKSPGGTVDGQLNFITGLEHAPTQGEMQVTSPNKINAIFASPQVGVAVWGVRQIALDSQWRYINARRLFMFVEKSVYNATWWVVFENNGPGLWARIKVQLDSFLSNLFTDGYFAGTVPSDGYFVICDETNNSQASIDAGEVIVDVGIAPNTPAEFLVFRFSQKTLGS